MLERMGHFCGFEIVEPFQDSRCRGMPTLIALASAHITSGLGNLCGIGVRRTQQTDPHRMLARPRQANALRPICAAVAQKTLLVPKLSMQTRQMCPTVLGISLSLGVYQRCLTS